MIYPDVISGDEWRRMQAVIDAARAWEREVSLQCVSLGEVQERAYRLIDAVRALDGE